MTTLQELANRVMERLEEDPNAPAFWELKDEIFPILAESLFEAMMITGEPQFRTDQSFEIAKLTTLFDLPEDIAAVTRVDSSGITIRKITVGELDRSNYKWRLDTGIAPKYWFPFGLTKIGFYPQLTVNVNVVLTGVRIPLPTGRPYTGAEVIPYRYEFEEAFLSYASHVARLKEGGTDFIQSSKDYDHFLDMMRIFSSYAWRKDDLRFTKVMGIMAKTEDK